ncbi:Serpin-ZX [Capsicum annuum]|uniref:Serpin-ZX n=1 Tax=Capsicum annuum TaxID=4072 RepID=A0A1U8GKU2_CAPAN|nr:serpin-ZX [Capsicum annuum]KAF3623130.1 Serpin-ZX [Capsicum annuum]KAF3677328.1 Serpin-ZX [Capsicum annuum]PHT84687.1 Serpin-ZX [Capsicum annuum]
MGLIHSRSHSHSCSSNSSHDQTTDMEMNESIITQTDVSFMLAKHVFSNEIKGDTNLVFSPPSIQIVLGLIAAGAKGPTRDQLLCFLKSKSIDELNSLYSHLVNIVFVDGSPNGGPRLSVANGVWIDQTLPLKPSFKKVVDKVYKAASNSVDFQNKATEVTNQVNQWAKMKTNDLIKEILPHGTVNNMTRLIFANALYFKGLWNDKFNASETEDHKFHLLRGGSVKAPFMTSNKKQYAVTFDGFKVLGLPYKHGRDTRRFCMYLILPDARDGLPALIDKISSEPGFLNHHLPCVKVKMIKLLIPKFKTTFSFEASKVLKGLGVTSPFCGGGLTEMVDSPLAGRLFVSQIFHKSFIEVNEEGTEAAAVTAGVVMTKSLKFEKEIDFVADHPFLFLIRDDATGVVLFIGSVLNPVAG